MSEYGRLGPGREFDLIRSFLPGLPGHEAVIVGAGDDAAVLRDGWTVSTDASVENVHFRRAWLRPEEIGYRAAAVAASDLAAMAAAPVALLISLVLPAADYGPFAERIMSGVARAAAELGAAIAGGDTTRTEGPLVIDIATIGRSAKPVLRSGAHIGDDVWVTGTLGGAAAAVAAWSAGRAPAASARAAFAEPQPRVRAALWLAERLELHAMIDLSDGLVSDAAHLAAASSVALRLACAALPIHEGARSAENPARLALTGGDDYELCFTAAPGTVQRIRAEFEPIFELPLSHIGQVLEGQGVEIVSENGQRLEGELRGYDHFGARS